LAVLGPFLSHGGAIENTGAVNYRRGTAPLSGFYAEWKGKYGDEA
jgi:hypothetical protein